MRSQRGRYFEEEQDVGRWLISFADFMTLLFAFFVVMYSISQVNETKYKILSESLTQAFDTPEKSIEPIQVGDINQANRDSLTKIDEAPTEEKIKQSADKEQFATNEEFKQLESGLRESLAELIEQGLAEIGSDANWININLRSGLLFPSGSDELNDSADPVLEEVTKHLNTNSQLILVHGHTDNIPINTERFPSNWELSSARAVAVVRKLQNQSVYAPRMSVEGHGEYQPIASNETFEGRAKNRRVVISISRKQRVIQDKTLAVSEESQSGSEKFLKESKQQKDAEPEIEVIRLPGGGMLIRGKDLPTDDDKNDSNN